MRKKLLSLLTVVSLTVATFASALTVNAKDVNDYGDVKPDDWFFGYVADVAEKNLMTGLNENTFGAGDLLSRAQFATVLYRMNGSPAVNFETKFDDVPDGHFFSIPITWASNVGVVTGYDSGGFGTGDEITREQMATMLFRYASMTGMDTSATADYSTFPDAEKVTDFATQSMSWAVGSNIISGDQGNLNPQGNTSRAVSATMMARFTGYTAPVPDDGNNEPATTGQQNALDKANKYLDIMAFSYRGLINQLEYVGFSTDDATYAADNCGANWKDQALRKAQKYLEISAFSYSELIGQLEYDKFTTDEATYAVDNCDANWKDQALKQAKRHLEISAFSYSGLIEQLESDKFSTDEATYAADNCDADWNEQAAKKASAYIKLGIDTKEKMMSELTKDGFTPQEAEYGTNSVKYD